MTITGAQLTAWVGAFLWPLFRIGAMLMVAPVYGAKTVPVRIRAGLAFAMAILMAPMIPAVPTIDVFSPESVLIILHQLIIGVAMGFALQLVMTAVITGGQTIALQMGLGFAVMVDPQNGSQAPVMSQYYILMVILVFLGLDGHLVILEVLADSFRTIPIAVTGLSTNSIWALVSWGGQIFAGAVGMALPTIASLLVVNLAFGIMTRAAPQLNIFAIGFPITMTVGFALVLVTLPSVLPHANTMFSEAYQLLRQILVAEQ